MGVWLDSFTEKGSGLETDAGEGEAAVSVIVPGKKEPSSGKESFLDSGGFVVLRTLKFCYRRDS